MIGLDCNILVQLVISQVRQWGIALFSVVAHHEISILAFTNGFTQRIMAL
jgi:hypothetical protein